MPIGIRIRLDKQKPYFSLFKHASNRRLLDYRYTIPKINANSYYRYFQYKRCVLVYLVDLNLHVFYLSVLSASDEGSASTIVQELLFFSLDYLINRTVLILLLSSLDASTVPSNN